MAAGHYFETRRASDRGDPSRDEALVADIQAGWYNDGTGTTRWWDGQKWTDSVQPSTPEATGVEGMIERARADAAAGSQPRSAQAGMTYVVLQVVLKEKFLGTGSGNLTELEHVINQQAALGYRLHTISTASSGSGGFGGGDRTQATMVFERL